MYTYGTMHLAESLLYVHYTDTHHVQVPKYPTHITKHIAHCNVKYMSQLLIVI